MTERGNYRLLTLPHRSRPLLCGIPHCHNTAYQKFRMSNRTVTMPNDRITAYRNSHIPHTVHTNHATTTTDDRSETLDQMDQAIAVEHHLITLLHACNVPDRVVTVVEYYCQLGVLFLSPRLNDNNTREVSVHQSSDFYYCSTHCHATIKYPDQHVSNSG